jgi:hypothetical protein
METGTGTHPLQESSSLKPLSVPPRVDAPTNHPAPREVSMMRVSILVGLSVGLITASGVASAQQTNGPFILGNIDSSCSTSGASAGDWTITCGDIAPGSGTTLIAPPSVDAGLVPTDVAPETEPAAEAAPVDEAVTDVPAEAVADTTADTDTDGDGISDVYEINVYATDPGLWDTDGDGLSDGDELLTTGSDPFLWDTDSDGIADGDEGAAETDPLAANEAVPNEAVSEASLVDSDHDRLADDDEASVGTDPTIPDADGDGYYDGDEVNLGTDPLDATSFPAG